MHVHVRPRQAVSVRQSQHKLFASSALGHQTMMVLQRPVMQAARSARALPSTSLLASGVVCPLSTSLAPPSRSFSSSSHHQIERSRLVQQAEEPKKKGILGSLLHGSAKAQKEGVIEQQSHSTSVARGKYVHEIQKHKVYPGKVDEYKELIGNFYTHIANSPAYAVKLTGSWETIVGELDTFYHIFEFEGYAGYDSAQPKIAQSKEYAEFRQKVMPLIEARTSQICQEFAFWASAPPNQYGGIYELRSYTLKPGSLLEWETEWRRGLEARRKFVEPIGAWFAQIGSLHNVVHMWQYDSLESRAATRAKAWEVETWSQTVSKTVKLCYRMQADILKPLPFSPLR
ncbi:uncharacterized protein L969DRAFT_95172 [Mixia osmundae IAM 14324]|uniref:NIPSNAP domain-containing protein n=1 Tax=Mixia osmundae (strain CBS 9802 / IAM 14324 / JCM 22182 / KY 12970) TaxID=764103 RepID=G7E6Y8_MIXOS|nr:uncharacterized protein L969DRAFT_95172 [Mixia osmundae IAM 14324]KEI39019.1 hypothetical protein L969DRAFT_95172 [Mixia osmundae IAM 14324]GAA98598.1 hypothetical protein E5Q_05285 [Mixia osmundae IAM 14324]